MMKCHRMVGVSLVVCLVAVSVVAGRIRFAGNGGGPAGGGMVNLPYQVQDAQGTTWMLYGSGWLQQQGNLPIY
jgi:hypothetical protein